MLHFTMTPSSFSRRNLIATLVLIGALAGLTGCADVRDQARDLALGALSLQLHTLKTDTTQLAHTAGSPANATKNVKAGDLHPVLPSPITGSLSSPGSIFTGIYGVTQTAQGVKFYASLQATADTTYGITSAQIGAYLCISVEARVSKPAGKLTIRDAPCRKDLAVFLRNYGNDHLVKLSDIPQASPK